MSSVGEFICYSISRLLLSRDPSGRYQQLSSITETVEQFDNWRDNNLQRSLALFPHIPVTGKTVVDFGCGGGQLSLLLKERGAAKVYGLDLNLKALAQARQRNHYGFSVEFLAGAESALPLPSSSVDLIYCLSVLEHIMDVDSILNDWRRVLRPGGHVMIQWSAWHHPDGAHLGLAIPIPYAQCMFSESTLARTSARIRLSQVYRPRFWDCDAQTGLRNEVRVHDRYTDSFLNKMSIGSFNERLKRTQFQVTHYECHPPAWFPHVRPLLKVPFFREHLSSFVTYVLTK